MFITEQTNPNGGGMWRKNRRDNGVTGCMGVDPNRNYAYMWGFNDIGSSPDPCHLELSWRTQLFQSLKLQLFAIYVKVMNSS